LATLGGTYAEKVGCRRRRDRKSVRRAGEADAIQA
jgi:hypothetical protein